MSLLPSRGPDTSTSQEGELQVVGVDDEVAPLLDALNSETARAILNEIYAEPGTPSEIADRLDMSIQKVSYHIEKLDEQDLIDVAGTQYSEKGQEMTVYQPPDEPTVLFVGTEERKRSLTTMVKRLLPIVGILALGSLVVEQLFGSLPSLGMGARSSADSGSTGGSGGDGGFDSAASDSANATGTTVTETPTPTDEPTVTTESGDGGDIGIMEVSDEETASATGGAPETETAADTATEFETEVATDTPTQIATDTARETEAYRSTELTETPSPDATDLAVETTAQATDLAASGGFDISPGVAFFLGGLTVLVVLSVWWAYTN